MQAGWCRSQDSPARTPAGLRRYDHLNEKIFDSLDDVRRKLALWRYDYNTDRPLSSLTKQTPQQARRTHEQFEGCATGALAQDDEADDPNPMLCPLKTGPFETGVFG
ncbi:transposase [Salipiger thiooxidans]|uniref:transposase n=1 Tax=Salipiger thiooxidans TaxID=282683 RepID=UPI001CD5115D|nr:transposase [Salipiger thiooxidans]MCA0851316.1 transposase [Salipiger thiooxidans]